MLGRSVLVVAAVAAILGSVACVSDEPVDLNTSDASAGGGGSSTSGGEHPVAAGGPNTPQTVCGLITNNPFPTCPAVVTSGGDPDCNDSSQPVCCPGQGCFGNTSATACPSGAPVFECFSSNQCPSKDCCVAIEPVSEKDPDCDENATITMPSNAGTVCNCAGASTRLCNSDGDCKENKKCKTVRMVIPNPGAGGGEFVRRVGVCR